MDILSPGHISWQKKVLKKLNALHTFQWYLFPPQPRVVYRGEYDVLLLLWLELVDRNVILDVNALFIRPRLTVLLTDTDRSHHLLTPALSPRWDWNKLAVGAFLTEPEGFESIQQSTWRPGRDYFGGGQGGFTLLTTCSGPITLWQWIRLARAGCSFWGCSGYLMQPVLIPHTVTERSAKKSICSLHI